MGAIGVGRPGPDASTAGTRPRTWEVVAGGLRLDRPSVGPLNRAGSRVKLQAPRPPPAPSIRPAGPSLLADGREVGVAGELAPEVADRYDLKGRVAVVMIDLAPLLDAPRRSWAARPISRYPAVDLDMAFLVDNEVTAAELEATVREVGRRSG